MSCDTANSRWLRVGVTESGDRDAQSDRAVTLTAQSRRCHRLASYAFKTIINTISGQEHKICIQWYETVTGSRGILLLLRDTFTWSTILYVGKQNIKFSYKINTTDLDRRLLRRENGKRMKRIHKVSSNMRLSASHFLCPLFSIVFTNNQAFRPGAPRPALCASSWVCCLVPGA